MPDNLYPLIQNALNYARANGQPLTNERRRGDEAPRFNLHGFTVAIRDDDYDPQPHSVTISHGGANLTLDFDKDGTFRIWDTSYSMDRLTFAEPPKPGDLSARWNHFQPEGFLAAMETIDVEIMTDWHPAWEEEPEYTIHQLLRLLFIPPPAAQQQAAAA